MSLFELSVPIRIYWDLHAADSGARAHYGAVCRDIIGLRILSLNLTDLNPGGADDALTVLEHLSGRGPAVVLTLLPRVCSPPLLQRLSVLGVRTLFLHLHSTADLEGIAPFLDHSPIPIGVSFEVDGSSWRELPDIVRWCAGNGISALSLPMQRLWQGGTCFYLRPREKQELAAGLRHVALPEGLKLTVHDPFLWKVVFPELPFPDAGCQGGNTMLAIAPDGSVYPCPSLPAPIGKLTETPLQEIVHSPRKRELRRDILSCPSRCAGCHEYPTCRGGCRGRGLVHDGSLDAPDPGCPG